MVFSRNLGKRLLIALVVWGLISATPALAQTGAESSVGYIDSALPTTQVRTRYDAAYRANAPDRAEYIYAKYRVQNIDPTAPGPPFVDQSVNYQDINTYLEWALTPTFSGFLDVPVRFLNPVINSNDAGLSDISTGFKWAFWYTESQVTTLQMRITAPTGDASLGLGTNHVSIEPALLLFRPLTSRLNLEGELRDWVPVGGTEFAGNIFRYGAGFSYRVVDTDLFSVTPVAEMVGWTVLGGRQFTFPNADIRSAAGDTIINAKVGLRISLYADDFQATDFYIGYGRALTGDVWYKDILRVELRIRI